MEEMEAVPSKEMRENTLRDGNNLSDATAVKVRREKNARNSFFICTTALPTTIHTRVQIDSTLGIQCCQMGHFQQKRIPGNYQRFN